jgi:hypothetical protein
VRSGPEILDENSKYITDIIPLLDAAATPDEAIVKITEAHPDYAANQLLGFGTQRYFDTCKAAP